MNDPRDKIRQFVSTNFYVANPGELTDDASLLDNGIIDSTGVLEVIAFLESTFAIQVEDAEMVPDNLDSIGKIAELVQRKIK